MEPRGMCARGTGLEEERAIGRGGLIEEGGYGTA